MKLLVFITELILFCGTSCTQSIEEQTAKIQSEKWIIKNVFPYFEGARFLTQEESDKLKIHEENNLTIFEKIGNDPMYSEEYYCYHIKKNDTLLFEHNICQDELYDYVMSEFRETGMYADTIVEQIAEYLGPLKNTIHFGSPLEKVPTEVEQKMKSQKKALCLISNLGQLPYLSAECFSSKIRNKDVLMFYVYRSYFTFDNVYTTDLSRKNILAVTVFLDENLKILNDSRTTLTICD
ncbi:hypothetical protein [Dysgonomonas massiliensis]|uniref:hypothetical protein n=1 Tax=Dysgonomonas massiliensis TaxID=2040292 RepID=UPI000C77DC8B|nr:hypothetical protein [Dysgonomonas massiliensis]